MGDKVYPVKHYYDNGILFGSFSKIVSPGMRIGWVVAKPEIINHLVTVKQYWFTYSYFYSDGCLWLS